jgi:hypothetical protein
MEEEKTLWSAALKQAQRFKIKPLLHLNADWDHVVCSGWVHKRGDWRSYLYACMYGLLVPRAACWLDASASNSLHAC